MPGRSYQDFALGQQAVDMAVDLRNGRLQIEEVGNYIRNNLGPGGQAVCIWRGTPRAHVNVYFYSVLLAVASQIRPIPPGEQGAP
jgi:hypothetical protein